MFFTGGLRWQSAAIINTGHQSLLGEAGLLALLTFPALDSGLHFTFLIKDSKS